MSQLKKAKIFHSFNECDKEVRRLRLLQQQYPLCPDVIPPELADLDQWVVWSYEVRQRGNGRLGLDKVPYQTKNPKQRVMRTCDSHGSDLTTALRCVETYQHIDGIGFVFSKEDGLSGVDFDNCRNPETGHIREEYQFFIDQLGGYAEVSPSGTGVKVWVKGTIADRYFKTERTTGFRILKFAGGEIEVYRRGQYFTVTTQCLKKVESITSAQTVLDVLSEWSLSEVSRNLSYNGLSGPEPTEEDAERELSLLEDYMKSVDIQPTFPTYPTGPVDIQTPATNRLSGPEPTEEDAARELPLLEDYTKLVDTHPAFPTYLTGPVDRHIPATQQAKTRYQSEPRCSRCGRKCQPQYELCSKCYSEGEPESSVVEEVCNYFSKFQRSGFSAMREYEIDIGTYTPRPDVVLLDQQENLAAIAECKRGGIRDNGIEQLKSYLSATDTRFGIFANSINPADWKFYENRRRHRFSSIDLSEFESAVVERLGERALLVDEIQALEDEMRRHQERFESLKAQKTGLSGEVKNLERELQGLQVTREQLERDNSDLRSQLTQTEKVINRKTEEHSHLKEQIGQLIQAKSQLHEAVRILGEQRNELASEIEKIIQTERELQEKIEPLSEQLGKLESYQLQTRIKKLMQTERDKQATCEKLKGEIEQLDDRISELATEIAEFDKKKRHIDTTRKQLEIETARLSKQKSGLETKIRELKQTEKDMHATCEQLEGEINLRNKQKSDLKRKIGIKYFFVALIPAAVVTIAGRVMDVFSGPGDAIITMLVLFATILFTGLTVEKIVLSNKRKIINWLKNLSSKEKQ